MYVHRPTWLNRRGVIRRNLRPVHLSALAMLIASGCAAPRSPALPSPDSAEELARSRLSGDPSSCGGELRTAALHRYVQATDGAFRWEVVQAERGADGVVLRLSLTSQEWQGISWQHSLLLFLPSQPLDADLLLLVLRQGDPAEADPQALRTISRATGTAAAFLFGLPNQPLFDGLEEDPLLAYTYSEYLRTGDASWPLLLPMVRSVVRAMDAVQEVSAATSGRPIQRYVVAGHSKRGHAAWLAGAVDPRVAGIIPVAIDILNSREQIAHHRAVAGGITASSQVFSEVIEAADSPRGRCLMALIDPFTYRAALAEPKLVVLATNDDYTPTDALNLYWDSLPGPRSVFYLPNTSHAGANAHPAVNATAFAFVRAVAASDSLPEIEWSADVRAGAVHVRVTTPAAARSAHLWTSRASGRDFRSSWWSDVAMRPAPGGAGSAARDFVAQAALPLDGYAALFVDVEFETDGEPFRLSTQIRVFEGGTGRIVVTRPSTRPPP